MGNEVVLLADDDQGIRTVISRALIQAGLDVQVTDNFTTLMAWLEQGLGNIVLSDVIFPDGNGLDILPYIQKHRPDMRAIMMSAQNTILTAIEATKGGAFEYLPKPFDLKVLVDTTLRARDSQKIQRAIATPPTTLPSHQLPLVGSCPAMQDVYRAIARLTRTNLSVLIVGESGTGKELVARALHDFSHRKNAPFIAVNMAAIPKNLIESELFGHEKGAFTGATARSSGRFEQARGGTLFFDEIGDMPLDSQTRLLRVLQEGEYHSVGGEQAVHTDVRIIAATHRDLHMQVREGLFREDLFYRLNVAPVFLPPLRERKEDIAELVAHFMVQATSGGLPAKILSPGACERLMGYSWPGNIRELENMIHRLLVLCAQDIIDSDVIEKELQKEEVVFENNTSTSAFQSRGSSDMENVSSGMLDKNMEMTIEEHLRDYFTAHGNRFPFGGLYHQVMKEVERPLIRLCLEMTGGNQLKSAKLLGLNRNTLRKKIRELDITTPKSDKTQ